MNSVSIKPSVRVFLFLVLGLSGCTTLKNGADISKKEFSVILYVSSENASFVDPVNIRVFLDRKKIVDQDFFGRPGAGHPEFKLTVSEGDHQLIVESNNGDAGLDVVFSVDRPTWLLLTYWGKNHFQLYISYKGMIFVEARPKLNSDSPPNKRLKLTEPPAVQSGLVRGDGKDGSHS